MSRFGSLWNLPVRTVDAFGHNALPVSSSGSFLPHFQGFQNFAATYPFKGPSPSHISPLNVSPERWETMFKKPLRTDLLRIRPARQQAPPGSALATLPQFEGSLSKIGRGFDIIQHTWVRLAQRAVGFFIFIFSGNGLWNDVNFEGAERAGKYNMEMILICYTWNYVVS